MIDLVFRGGAEAADPCCLRTPRTFCNFPGPRLQLETPVNSGRSWMNLHFFVSRQEPEHLYFQRVGSRREIGQFVIAGFIGGGHGAVIALGGDHGSAGQRLAAEFDCPGGRHADLRT